MGADGNKLWQAGNVAFLGQNFAQAFEGEIYLIRPVTTALLVKTSWGLSNALSRRQ